MLSIESIVLVGLFAFIAVAAGSKEDGVDAISSLWESDAAINRWEYNYQIKLVQIVVCLAVIGFVGYVGYQLFKEYEIKPEPLPSHPVLQLVKTEKRTSQTNSVGPNTNSIQHGKHNSVNTMHHKHSAHAGNAPAHKK